MTPEIQMAVAQMRNNYPTHLSLIDSPDTLQIDYAKFGGKKRYDEAKAIYWFKFNSRIPTWRIAEIWGKEVWDVEEMIKDFKKELHSPIKYYND